MTAPAPDMDEYEAIEVIMLARTSTQEPDAAPYAIRPATDAGGLHGPQLGPQGCVVEESGYLTKPFSSR